ncbi:conserved hypothetical protein [Verticillium alfalfae VaMs.102]|uniref:Uncharacterized protein n=1 Tax=Verticillium alfalfae (strain VaMs.102 / ATCC MYA-4576 / FGSC 10136) TaxID=526221 RepID=C9S540_VERA1|nr:conserved hypothetical protein [Verticillium alfalfae VaMs.102]EEY14140.1 conserved hypothetical protein [Verticillium alfalfae VaMs.102]
MTGGLVHQRPTQPAPGDDAYLPCLGTYLDTYMVRKQSAPPKQTSSAAKLLLQTRKAEADDHKAGKFPWIDNVPLSDCLGDFGSWYYITTRRSEAPCDYIDLVPLENTAPPPPPPPPPHPPPPPATAMPSNNFIHAGGVGGGVVPQLDAPHSASNAGDRRVTIRCMQSSISLPVTPDTSPVDLLFSAANLMSHNIDPPSSIVVECYFSFGLERPLRRYERIRDILNSWERDVQHSLLIIPGGAADISSDLSIEPVPRSHDAPPGFINFPMHLSHRPGRWNKRLITLLETGQVYSHKKPDAKLSDKDSTALCNLSDFDVYQVTDQDMLKRLKVPKKHVLAIKSQQKNSVFLNTENFIHFLSTDDTTAARKLHKSVQEWRSWYLVNKKVDLAKKEKALQTNHDRLHVEKPTDIVKSGHHRLKVSVDETPYTIGKFEPLLDMNRFDKPLEEFGKDFLPERPAEKQRPPVQKATARPTTATRQAIASPLHSPRAPVSPPQRIDPFAREDEFKSNGLLGKVYEDRKHHAELAERTSDDSPAEGPFTGGLLQNRLQEESRLQEPSRQARSLDRSNTKRRPSAPPERRFQLDATAEEPPLESPFTGGLLQTRLQEESRQPGRSTAATREGDDGL